VSIPREVLRLTWPAVMTSFLQTAVFLTDRLLLGRYSEDALASMQVQGPLIWSVTNVCGGLLVGAIPLVARAVGAGDRERASATARAALRLSFALGAVVAVVGFVGVGPVVRLLGPASPELRALSERYLGITLFGFPQMFVAMTASLMLAASGNTRTPFLVGVFSNGLNAAFAIVLIFGAGPIPALGVGGAAAGSVMAFSIEAVLLLWALGSPSSSLVVRQVWRAGGAEERRARRDTVRLSAPAVAERVIMHGGYLAYTSVIAHLGALVMAGNQALITIESICFLSADGFGIASAALVGQSLGRKNPADATRAGWLGVAFAALALSILGCTIWWHGRWLLELFVPAGRDGSELVRTGSSALPLLALSQPFLAAGVVLGHALRGAGDTRSPLIASLLGGLLVRVTLAWWLGVREGLGLYGIWIASSADWVLRTLLLSAIFAAGRWRAIRL
jgi:putative MATE family efflux protein